MTSLTLNSRASPRAVRDNPLLPQLPTITFRCIDSTFVA